MRNQDGFSLVELLIVMLILGLLAAVAIPSFFEQKDKAGDAQAKEAVRTAETAAETLAVDNDGRYDGPRGVTVANLRNIEATLINADLSVVATAQSSYTVEVLSDTGNTFDVARHNDGSLHFLCDVPGNAGCPEDSTWAD